MTCLRTTLPMSWARREDSVGRFSILLFSLLAACERSGTSIDAGTVCIADEDDSFLRPGVADINVGEPIPLIVWAGFGCSTRVTSAECIVDVEGDEAIISSVIETTTPGRLPWQGQNMCLTVGSALCEMPPSTEGITRVRYGTNSMVVTVPGENEGCIDSGDDIESGGQ